MKKLQLTFNEKFNTIHRIGMSEYSEVYLAFDSQTQQEYAIKLQSTESQQQYLQRQAKIYRVVKGGVGIPNLYWYGVQNNYRALITDIHGPSLRQLMKFCGNKFTLKTTLLIADQIIDRIQWVHSKKFIYNDIDPDNFLVGLREQADKIFMIDFGNCKKYVDENGKHIEFTTQNKAYPTSLSFKSVHAHIHKTLSRRDDLQTLGYMLVFLLKGSLPWQKLKMGQQQQNDDQYLEASIKQKKVSIPTNILCQDLPQQFIKYFEYVKSLQFEEQPDYVWVKRLFKDLFEQKGYDNNRVMDWAEKHTH